MIDCQITYILNIKKNTTGMPHLKKSTKFSVKTQKARAHNRSLGVDVMILKQRAREQDDSAHSSDFIKGGVGKL